MNNFNKKLLITHARCSVLGARCSGGLREKRRSWKRPAPTPRGSVSVSANRGSRNQKRTPPPNDLREVDDWSPVDLRKRKKSSKRGGIQLPRSSCPRDCAAWWLVGRRSLSDPNYIVVRTHGRASARCLHGSVVPPRRATPISMVSSGLRCQQGSPPHSSATQNASSTISVVSAGGVLHGDSHYGAEKKARDCAHHSRYPPLGQLRRRSRNTTVESFLGAEAVVLPHERLCFRKEHFPFFVHFPSSMWRCSCCCFGKLGPHHLMTWEQVSARRREDDEKIEDRRRFY